ncbi:hypothetical protein AVV48_gp24 [Acinetobacter phage phiAC-1]|uniref:hypothetical protein n=1 Tax=Acinetobacter phage phiAC-1 TaxID=1229760 RepID=UPI00028A8E0E|nr:hypothetical protein AVV48_gp24 [Acinetobacter phage phiAC-1]AFU62273.1 hypothetical protein phiAC-1_0024 [Acinetobacter phage phiAC-1]
MKLTEFLEKIGNENLKIQVLHNSIVSERKTKNDIEITFATENGNSQILSKSNRVGIVVWMDAEKYNEAIK